jgi:hypothetical protein
VSKSGTAWKQKTKISLSLDCRTCFAIFRRREADLPKIHIDKLHQWIEDTERFKDMLPFGFDGFKIAAAESVYPLQE